MLAPAPAASAAPQQAHAIQTPEVVKDAEESLSRGNADEAIQRLTSYLRGHPENVPARLALGEAYAYAGQAEMAEEAFQAVLRVSPDNYVALADLGEIYDKTGHPENAEPMLSRAVKASNGAPAVRREWATVLSRLHRYKEAQQALTGVSPPEGAEEQVAFFRLKGSIALGLGDAASAASDMERALALKPADDSLNLATAVAEMQGRNWARAESLAQPVFERTRDPRVGVVLLEAELSKGTDFQQTLDALRATPLPAGDEMALRQRLAEVLTSHGRFLESTADFERIVELQPNRADLIFDLALAQFNAGRLDDALKDAGECKTLGDTADVEDLLGDIEEARGDNLAAVRDYQAAVTLAPNEEKYRLSLALELIRHKTFEPAKVVLKQALEAIPNSWRLQVAQGMVEFFAGSDEEASRILVHAAGLAPDPGVVVGYLGGMEIDERSSPDAAALRYLCQYSGQHARDEKGQFYCGALMLRRDYTNDDKSNLAEILRHLRAAAALDSHDAGPHCELGRAYKWTQEWQQARQEMESCVRMDPGSTEAHYRLAQIYEHFGQQDQAQREMKLYNDASKQQADENARREKALRTFLYTIEKPPAGQPN